MRLIDADALRDKLSTVYPLYATDEYDYCTKDILDKVDDLIQKQPNAYNVDKVVEQLKEMRDTITHNISLNSQGENVDEEILNEISHYQKIIKIVKSGGIE